MLILAALRASLPAIAHRAATRIPAPNGLAAVVRRSIPVHSVTHFQFGRYKVAVLSYKEHQALAQRNFAERLKKLSEKKTS